MKLLLILPGLLIASFAALAAEIDIDVKSAAVVLRGDIRIEQIATVTCKEAGLAECLGSLGIGSAPAPGNARLVGRDQIAAALERAGHEATRLRWRGAAACSVVVKAARFSGEDIARAGRDYLTALPQFQRDDVRVECEQTPRDYVFAAGQNPPALQVSAAGVDRPWGRLRVFVKVSSDDRVLATVPVTFLVTSRQKILVAARAIVRGELVDAAAITTREMLLGPQSDADGWLTREEDAIGKKAVRAIAAGMPVTASTVVQPFAVRRGDDVSVALRSSHMEVLAKGVVQRDAFLGDAVPVKVLNTGKELMCKVTATGTVELPL